MIQKKPDAPNAQDQPSDIPAEANGSEKIGLKAKPQQEGTVKKEDRWKKVSAIFEEAYKAYTDGAGFGEVMATLIETLKNLAKSEVPAGLGGLGVNDGPEMDLPQQPPDEQAQEGQ